MRDDDESYWPHGGRSWGVRGLWVSGHSPASSGPLRLGRDRRLSGIWPISPQARERPRRSGVDARLGRNSSLGNLGPGQANSETFQFFDEFQDLRS